MTIQNPPLFLQSGSHPAEDLRRWISTTVEDQEGLVYGTTGWAVTQKSGGANMSVDVASGRAYVAGDEATYQGMYFVENRGNTNVTITAADATNPRRDLIVLKVQDSAYSGGSATASLAAVAGTPGVAPSDPSAPSNSITLARVAVAANATSITNANITDLRAAFDSWKKPKSAACTVQLDTASTSPVSVPGCNLTFTTPRANVQVEIRAEVGWVGYLAGDYNQVMRVTVDGTNIDFDHFVSTDQQTITSKTYLYTVPSAGSHTLNLQVFVATGSGTVTVLPNITRLFYMGPRAL